MRESATDVGISSGFKPVLWASIRLRFPAGCGSISLLGLDVFYTLAPPAVFCASHRKTWYLSRSTSETPLLTHHLQCKSTATKLDSAVGWKTKPQMPHFPQSAGSSPQRTGNLTAFEWKNLRTTLERRSAVLRNNVRSALETFPQSVGNILRLTSFLSIVSETL